VSCANPIKSYTVKSHNSKPSKTKIKKTSLKLDKIFLYKGKEFKSNGSMDLEDAIRDAYDGNSRDDYRYYKNRNYKYGWEMIKYDSL